MFVGHNEMICLLVSLLFRAERPDSPPAAFLNLQPAFRLSAVLIIHYELHMCGSRIPDQ